MSHSDDNKRLYELTEINESLDEINFYKIKIIF